MKTSYFATLLAASVATLALAGPVAAYAADDAQHDHNHAAESAGKSTAAAPTPTEPAAVMHQMHAAHEKMMAAKTPAERQAAMKEHGQAMQNGMKMMQMMMDAKGDNDGAQGMKSRMDMMTMMMQMMMDRRSMDGPMGGGCGMHCPATSPPTK